MPEHWHKGCDTVNAIETENDVALLEQIRELGRMIQAEPSCELYRRLAQCYAQLGMEAAAMDAVRQVLRYQPGDIDATLLLGDLHRAQQEYDEAAAAYDLVLGADADNAAALLGQAQLALSQSLYARAREFLAKASACGADVVLLRQLQRQLDEATCKADNCVAEEQPLLSATLARLYLSQGMPEKAAAVYRQLLKRDPGKQEYAEELRKLRENSVAAPVLPAKTASLEEYLACWLQAIKRRRDNV